MNRATIIYGIGGGVLALIALAPATGMALGDLARAREARTVALDEVARPAVRVTPLVSALLRVPGGSQTAASRALMARVRTLAAAGGILVEQADAKAGPTGLIRIKLRVSGPSKAVIALTDRIEREAPLFRMTTWRVTALPNDGLRLDGEAVAPWR